MKSLAAETSILYLDWQAYVVLVLQFANIWRCHARVMRLAAILTFALSFAATCMHAGPESSQARSFYPRDIVFLYDRSEGTLGQTELTFQPTCTSREAA